MAIQLVIDGVTYSFPTKNERGWGDEATNAIKAIVDKLNEISDQYDIPVSSFTLANNQSSAADITGLAFDTSTVRGASIIYSIYRTSGGTEKAEEGILEVVYNNIAGSWSSSKSYTGAAGVIFSVSSSGQVQYTSSNYAVGTMKFRALVQPQ